MFFINFVIYILLPVAALIYYYFKKKFSHFKNLNVPHIEPKFPLGNLHGVGSTRHMYDLVREIYDKCSGKDVIAGMYSLTQPFYFITDLELVKNVTIRDFNNFVNRNAYVNEEEEPLTAHLFALEDDKWRYVRNKLSPAFTSGKMKAMYYTIGDKGHDLVACVDSFSRDGESIDIKEVTNCFATDVVSSVAFGMESNTMKGEHRELKNFFKQVFGAESVSMLKFFFLMTFPRLSKFLKLRQFGKEMSDFFINIVSDNIAQREKTNDNRTDFLNMLIQLKNKGTIDGEFSTQIRKLTMNEILPQAFVFFFAGSDATSTVISFALIELAVKNDVQEKLRNEINEKTKADNGEITYDNLQDMTYLSQVVNETLRMYTGGFALMRRATEDYAVPNSKHVIPKGSTVFIPVIGFHFDEKYFKNANTFDPDRWTPEEIAKRPSNAYIPFGDGPRNCIGMRFALLTVKYGIAVIVKNFNITPDKNLKYPIKMNPKNPNMEPVGGFSMKFERIKT